MFHFSLSLWCFFYYVKTTLSMLLLQQHIFNGIKITLFLYVQIAHKTYFIIKLFLVCHCEMFCIMLQLHFSRFLKHVYLITLEIRPLLVCSSYVRKYDTITLCVWSSFLDYSFVVHLCNILKYWHYSYVSFSFVIATSFYYVTIRYLFVQIISFFDDVRITLNCGNCWNVWIVYGSYVIKWSYFSYIVF